MSGFKAKMHQNRFRLGLAGFKNLLLRERRYRKGGEGGGRVRQGEGRVREGRKGGDLRVYL